VIPFGTGKYRKLILSKGIKVFRLRPRTNWNSSKWWFDNIHRTALKCLLNYSFIEQKQQNWQDEYPLNVLTTPINTYLTEVSSKRRNGKAIRMIRQFKYHKARKKNYD
jgi:hypothetical protein